MQLSKLINGIDASKYNFKDVEIKSLEFDSRKVKPQSLFIAIKGKRFDGHKFIEEAEKNGAGAIITQKHVQTDLPQIVVPDTRQILGELTRKFYGDFKDLIKIGITGTNGKTTTSFLIHSILQEAGKKPGLIGTIYYIGEQSVKAVRTTPESLDIFKMLDQFRKNGARAVVMEVSSHALSLKRVDEIQFQIAVFTNLSQDHLDFHKTIEEYKKAKMRLFLLLDEDGCAVFNKDDSASETIESMHLNKMITYGVENKGDIYGQISKDSLEGLEVEVFESKDKYKIHSKLIGSFNIYNILAAFAVGRAVGLESDTIVRGIENLAYVKGRMERVVDNIFVDYSHTPSAIENALMSLKNYAKGRLIIVFGCGGDRDKDKRPKMGAIASQLADFVVITSDNPRSESPSRIIKDIEPGIKGDNYKIIEDRQEAIEYSIANKKPEDIVLIAGKGHEEYQIIGDKVIDFDDAKVARQCIENL
jgi:UDP-N-acetylmuramyl-tripeptide synthetase